jgi:hypothetical protein
MRTYLICLCLLLFVLCSCNKKSVLPEKYNFLLGKWRCIDCNDPTTVEIGKRSLTINSLNYRRDKIWYNISESSYYNTVVIYLNGDTDNPRYASIDLHGNSIYSGDTIILFNCIENYDLRSVMKLVRY